MLKCIEKSQVRTIAEECGVSPDQKEKSIKKFEKLDACIVVDETKNVTSMIQIFNFTDDAIGVNWKTLEEKEEVPAKNSVTKQFDTTVDGEEVFTIFEGDREHLYSIVLEKNKLFQYHVNKNKVEEIVVNIDEDTYRNSDVFKVTASTLEMVPLTKNFFDAFDKNGRYFCEDMEDYLPPQTKDGDKFIVDYYRLKDR